ncbi:Phosphatidylinositol transfer protein [Thalictrum thalictroides]|uniref:Phosphatidylinositol transfer protein n=1 Tax=Thalictrum thalictroides TaxID=46969 RepID=A0A7J6W6T9_THATH|nr:Phosphatidylinositol transfer protein [Thalictrum thalictroides]
MSTGLAKSTSNGHEKSSLSVEELGKINEVRRSLGQMPDKLFVYCSDASITRHLRARNWNVKKAIKMLRETLKWRLQYKPEEIRWEEISHEAETGKIYRSNYLDKYGRSVLIMRPSSQNTKSTKGQIRYLVYCMENAILNLPAEQEQMVWLIDFHGFNMSHISVKVTKETAHVLQEHYPERLGVAILYNPPKIFESFWTVVKPFLEPKTYRKVKFAYSDDVNSKKMMEDLFDMDKLEASFGGNNQMGFDINEYATRMREDDKRMPLFWTRETSPVAPGLTPATIPFLDSAITESDSEECGKEQASNSSSHEIDSEQHSPESSLAEEILMSNELEDIHVSEGTTNLGQGVTKVQ